jgi:hypothetical protein
MAAIALADAPSAAGKRTVSHYLSIGSSERRVQSCAQRLPPGRQ